MPTPFFTHDPRFNQLFIGHVGLEKLHTGSRWAEGPVYVPAGRFLLWSDIPNDRVLRYDDTDGSVSVFMQPCGNQNGHFLDHEARVISCEHRGRCISRLEHDGTRKVLADHYQGKRLNSPNDVVVKSDASIWFTDPTYGIDTDYEGDAAPSEIGVSKVYRIDPQSGALDCVITDRLKPNGLAFSPDERLLYVVDTGRTHQPDLPMTITVYPVNKNGQSVGAGRLFATCPDHAFDGLRCDTHGNVWAASGEGVRCFAPDGTLIGEIAVGEKVANLCFGGVKRNRLFICGQTSLYSVFLNARGAHCTDVAANRLGP